MISVALLAAVHLAAAHRVGVEHARVDVAMSRPISTIEVVEDLTASGFDATLACYTSVKMRAGDGDLAVDGVFQLAKSHDANMAYTAVDVLARIGTPDARGALAVVLCGDADPMLRARAADRLGDIADGESAFLLAVAADHEHNVEVRDVIIANIEKFVASQPQPAPDGFEKRAIVKAIGMRTSPTRARRAIRRTL